jgi:3-hydroxyisobutyrate dehydrogenase-like beta-hydroxyacid dehydrogenase
VSNVQKQIRVGIVGYGEIGSTWGAGLRQNGLVQVSSYDKLAFDGPYSALIQDRAAEAGVTLVSSNKELAEAADVILGATPGSSSWESADLFAPHLTPEHVFVDIASATPKVKIGVADRLKATGAIVGDGSIMGTPRDGLGMPIIASGPAAQRFKEALSPWGMNIEVVGDRLGTASGIKIMRSVLIKGLEALLDEMILGARHYGVEEIVLKSAAQNLSIPFMVTVDRVLSTGVIHAKRRAEEVEMAAEALQDAGVEPIMTRSTAERLRWVESLGLKEHFNGIVPPSYKEAMDAIAERMTGSSP